MKNLRDIFIADRYQRLASCILYEYDMRVNAGLKNCVFFISINYYPVDYF